MTLLLACGLTACDGTATGTDGSGDPAAAEVAEPSGTLGFTLTSDLWQPEWGDCTVVVQTMDGEQELSHEYFRADVGQTYSLDYGPGTYRFALVASTATYGDQVFKGETATVDFDGTADRVVAVPVVLDDEATAQRVAEREAAEAQAAEEARRAEEERQRAEEEARRAEEARQAEERARAEAEAQAQREAEAAAAQQNEQTVYITNTGAKYHNGGCRYLSKSKIPISLDDAIARGYEPCKVCH